MFYTYFNNIVDIYAPLKEHRVKNIKQPEWLSQEILQSIEMRDYYKKHGEQALAKYWKKRSKFIIQKSKSRYFINSLKQNRNNPKVLWKLLNDLNPKDEKEMTQSLNVNDQNLDNPIEIANAFNTHFTNIIEKIRQGSDPNTDIEISDALNAFLSSKLPDNELFQIPEIKPHEVFKSIQNLDEKKAKGLDDIGISFLKEGMCVITEPLTHIINQSINTGIFPDKWKEARVLPLHKSGLTDDPYNYRPISILSVLSKIIERHVHDQIYKHLSEHNLLYEYQSGFRPQHSCEAALLQMIDTWLKAIDDNQLVGTIFLDLQKAFDVVDHSILVKKLGLYGLSENSVKWFSSYLSNRKQKVSLNGCVSDFKEITAGVPQGSILGPLLFIIFINDMFMHDSSVDNKNSLYADDSSFYTVGNTVAEIEMNLNQDLKKVTDWCTKNRMFINKAKTKSMLLCTRQKRMNLDSTLKIKIDDDYLENSKSEKVLGVTIDESLCWTEQVDKTCKKIIFNLHTLKEIKKNLPVKERLLFYNCYILPHLNYCCSVWGNCPANQQNRVTKLQKRAAHLILDADLSIPSSDLFKKLKWLPFPKYVEYQQSVTVYKSLNELNPHYMNKLFSYTQENHSYGTRNATSSLLALPKCNKSIGQKCISYSGPKVWNGLTEAIRCAPSLPSFKSRYLKAMYCTTL